MFNRTCSLQQHIYENWNDTEKISMAPGQRKGRILLCWSPAQRGIPCALEETPIEEKLTWKVIKQWRKQFKQLPLCFVRAWDLLALKLGSIKVVISDGISSIREMKSHPQKLTAYWGSQVSLTAAQHPAVSFLFSRFCVCCNGIYLKIRYKKNKTDLYWSVLLFFPFSGILMMSFPRIIVLCHGDSMALLVFHNMNTSSGRRTSCCLHLGAF